MKHVSIGAPPRTALLVAVLSALACTAPGASGHPGASSPTVPPREAPAATSLRPADLPEPARLQQVLDEAHQRFKDVNTGRNADYIPALAKVNPRFFGLALVTVNGEVYQAGDAEQPFAIESISKLFVLSHVLDERGPEEIQRTIGVEPTGMPFNSAIPLELKDGPVSNPFVNAGAIATTSRVRGRTREERWGVIAHALNEFAGRPLTVNQEVFESEAATNTRNKGLAELMRNLQKLEGDSLEAVDLYTEQCSVNVTAVDLAVMGATLANEGLNPRTSRRVVQRPEHLPRLLAATQLSGLYDASGTWAFTVGLPAKSGVGGGLVAVVPGRFALATFSPPLDAAGNSVRGQLAMRFIAEELGANVFAGRARYPPGRSGGAPTSRWTPGRRPKGNSTSADPTRAGTRLGLSDPRVTPRALTQPQEAHHGHDIARSQDEEELGTGGFSPGTHDGLPGPGGAPLVHAPWTQARLHGALGRLSGEGRA